LPATAKKGGSSPRIFSAIYSRNRLIRIREVEYKNINAMLRKKEANYAYK